MTAMNHKATQGNYLHCIWCGEQWPCLVAKVRRELADVIRAAIENFDLDDHWAVMYQSSDVDTLPDRIDID